MAPVTLSDMLAARETRAALREELRQTSGLPVLTFSINCPGPEKDSTAIRGLLRHAADCFRELAAAHELHPQEEHFRYPATGPFLLVAIAGAPLLLKQMGSQIEDLFEYGRLLDIDVYDASGRQLSRTLLGLPLRPCFLCANDAITCMRQGCHSAAELQHEFHRRIAIFINHAAIP